MKKIYFPIFVLALSLLTFISCSKDAEEIDQSANQTDFYENLKGQDYLDYYTTPSIFFNMAEVNEADQTVSGWFVNRAGQVYTYETLVEKFSAIDPIINISRMDKLQSIGELTDKVIDLEELVEYYKRTRNAANGDFKYSNESTSSNISTFFNAYDLKLGNGACLNCPVSQVSRDENAQLVLKTRGIKVIGEINVPSARDIVQWMYDITESL